MPCPHLNFAAVVDVARLAYGEDGPVTGWSAELHVRCADCGEEFVFLGVPGGYSPGWPCASPCGTEVRLPMLPASDKLRGGRNVSAEPARLGRN